MAIQIDALGNANYHASYDKYEANKRMITIVEIVNLAINGASLLIVGGLAVWIFKFQNEKLSLKDEQIASLKRERDEAISARDERIKLLEQERDATRAVAQERLDLSNERREAAEERLNQLLEEQSDTSETSVREVARQELTDRIMMDRLLEALSSLTQLPEDDSEESLEEEN